MENNILKPLSILDEIYHLTLENMRSMELQTLQQLKKQATKELERAKLTKGCIDLVLSLKSDDEESNKMLIIQNQKELLN